MPHMNETGPEGKGSGTGRRLGKCKDHNEEEALKKLSKGMGKGRQTGGSEGKGKRLGNRMK
ncbi:MAG: DUF5320 family protein [Bacteroidales bacterium]|nr:DUF5320 family protein [Bacteroidales bacterium]